MTLGVMMTSLDRTPRTPFMKEKFDKLVFTKIKNFDFAKKKCKENEKKSHRPEENICKGLI